MEYKHVCEKCNYRCNFESQWIKHCETELHKTGKRKKRTDYREIEKCKKCDYITKNHTTMKKHYLNEHTNKEELEKEFKLYCKLCDFGTFSKNTINIHNNIEKHKKYIIRTKKNDI